MQLIQKHSFKILVCLTSLLVLSSFLIDPPKKTLFIIGDSTVQNTTSPTGMWGWGSVIKDLLDTNNIQVSNQAKAGRSTRTFVKEGRWDKTLAAIQPGDYLIMQFGHNEGSRPDTSKSGYRGVLKGIWLPRGFKRYRQRFCIINMGRWQHRSSA
ncbi:MAG: SGNH/GDSL hydrolase family protein [Bacteroidetes bacterium]|nr:SGNH/GDSL hydrolase family protein [Bacteroidota bacterium]